MWTCDVVVDIVVVVIAVGWPLGPWVDGLGVVIGSSIVELSNGLAKVHGFLGHFCPIQTSAQPRKVSWGQHPRV